MVKRTVADLRVQVWDVDLPEPFEQNAFSQFAGGASNMKDWYDIEIRSGASKSHFSRRVDCKVLVVRPEEKLNMNAARQADVLLTNDCVPSQLRAKARKLSEFLQVLKEITQRAGDGHSTKVESNGEPTDLHAELLDATKQTSCAA